MAEVTFSRATVPGKVRVTGERNETVYMVLKALPRPMRSWSGSHHAWYVRDEAVEGLARKLSSYGVHVRRDDLKGGASGGPRRAAPRGTWADQLLAAAGPLEGAVYRALSKVLHPDQGGDAELMKQLNAARDRRAL